jgi:hypothetical protein
LVIADILRTKDEMTHASRRSRAATDSCRIAHHGAPRINEIRTLWVVLATVFLAGCYTTGSQSSTIPKSNATPGSKNTQTFVWAETGLSLALTEGWRMDSEIDDDSQRRMIGPDNSRFSVWVTTYESKFGNRSIEDETNNFYKTHENSEEEDLRYLEVDGVKGVHYLRDDKGWDENYQPQDQKHIIWNAQRMYNGTRQGINVTISSPSRNFAKDRETLYWLLQSIRFRTEKSH